MGDLKEVGHPTPTPGTSRGERTSVMHIGPVATGRVVSLDDQLRQEFAYHNSILAYDSVMDSKFVLSFFLNFNFFNQKRNSWVDSRRSACAMGK